jgi:hypothetical protein
VNEFASFQLELERLAVDRLGSRVTITATPSECRERGTVLAITLGKSEHFLNYSSGIVEFFRMLTRIDNVPSPAK